MAARHILVALFLCAAAGCGGSPSTPAGGGSVGGGVFGVLANPSPESPEEQAVKNLKELTVALHTYHDTNNCLPNQTGAPDTAPDSKLSWRVAILPYMCLQGMFLYKFKHDEPWDSPHNLKVLNTVPMPDVFRNPRFQPKEANPNLTYFQGIVGDGGIFSVAGGATLTATSHPTSAAQTILIVEAGNPVPWTKPDDYEHVLNKPLPALGGPRGDFFLAAFADGHVQRISKQTPEKILRCMMQWDNTTPFVLPKP